MAYPYINAWAVLLAALAFWALGALWYGPVLFSKRWRLHFSRFKLFSIWQTSISHGRKVNK